MTAETLGLLGQVAGVAGIALGVLLILFRDFLRKSIFASLTKDQSYRLLRLLLVLVWSIAIIGIGAWLWVTLANHVPPHGTNENGGSTNSGAPETNVSNDKSPLIVGNIKASSDGSTSIEVSDDGEIRGVPVTLIIDIPRDEPRHYDYSILFDITNTAESDLRLVDVFVRTIEWSPLEQIVRYMPAAGIGETRKFFGIIDKEPKDYRAALPDDDNFLKLTPGELDTVALMINAQSEGKYKIQVDLEYSVGGKTDRVVIGPFADIRFLDRGRIDTLPR